MGEALSASAWATDFTCDSWTYAKGTSGANSALGHACATDPREANRCDDTARPAAHPTETQRDSNCAWTTTPTTTTATYCSSPSRWRTCCRWCLDTYYAKVSAWSATEIYRHARQAILFAVWRQPTPSRYPRTHDSTSCRYTRTSQANCSIILSSAYSCSD